VQEPITTRQHSLFPRRSRREFLRAGGLALGGLTAAEVLAGRAAAGTTGADTSVILFYQWGGPSQLETYDLKTSAPSEYRSLFRSIATNVPGIDICEHFPRQANVADKFSLIRSLHHEINIHNDAAIEVLTGKRPTKLDPTSSAKSEHPDFAMVSNRVLGPHPKAMPRHVTIPSPFHMTRPTYLGAKFSPYASGDPSAENYAPPHLKLTGGLDSDDLASRRELVDQLDRLRRHLDLGGAMRGTDEFRQQAFQMLASPRVADAFDVAREDSKVRDRYGRHTWGQSCLLARRLVEAGTSVVTIYSNTPQSGPEYTNWDDHADNAGRPGHFAEYMARRLPFMDEALSALIEDVYERGLAGQVMIIAVGEFGRTPRIAHRVATGSTGRDHWPQAYTALVSGGGLRMGQVVGATNSKSEYPTERPITPQDLLATVYRHLGIDPEKSLVDFSGRPVPILGSGRVIDELV
jgi:hypothetical protein